MKTGINFLIICLSISFFLISCGSADPKAESVIDNPEESVEKESILSEFDCENLPTSFSSYDEAKQAIEGTDFRIEETVNTSKSSWIRGAYYYSCDGKVGYFLLITDSQDYLYAEVPLDIWYGFKNAESFGRYFNQRIKNEFQIELRN